jgi:hypothetical protein
MPISIISSIETILPKLFTPKKMLVLFTAIALFLFLPLILADPQGLPFTCASFEASDRRAFAFRGLSPFCCPEGLVDDELKIGRKCVLARKATNVADLEGGPWQSCGVGKVMSCCLVLVCFFPFLSSCKDSSFVLAQIGVMLKS